MNKIRNWYRQRRRRQALSVIRQEMEAMGHDTSGLSDEQLEAKWTELWEQFREGMQGVSVSAAQAANACHALAVTVGNFETAIITASWPDVVLEDLLDAEYVGE